MDGFIIVADVLLPLLLNVLCINDLLDGSDPTGIDGLLEIILLPEGLLLLLELKERSAFCFVNDRGIYGGRLGDLPAVKVIDAAREAHLGLVKDKREAAMVSFPLAGGETARNLGKLGDEELDTRRCRLAEHLVKILVPKFFPHHFGDCSAQSC